MKTAYLPLLLGILFAQVAEAANMAEITPLLPAESHCRLMMSNPLIDYGSQSRWQLQPAASGGNALTLGKRTLLLSAICPYLTPMILAVRGAKRANGHLAYGADGHMTIRIFDLQVDGQLTPIASATAEGAIIGEAAQSQLLHSGSTFAAVFNQQIAKGRVLAARIEIEPIQPEQETRVTGLQKSESHLTFELLE